MPLSPVPTNETARLQALYALGVLDSPADERFDRITRIAQQSLQLPIVGISLVDTNRLWLKSCHGLDVKEILREGSFCAYAIMEPDVFIVPNTRIDPRFAASPLVTGTPSIGFYVGIPLILGNGQCIGTLCALDYQPYEISTQQIAVLRDLAQCVVEALELLQQQQHDANLAQSYSRYVAIIESSEDAILSKTLDGIITSCNPAAEKLFGYTPHEIIGQPMTRLIPADRQHEEVQILDSIRKGEHIAHFETVRLCKGDHPIEVSVSISPIYNARGEVIGASKIIRDLTEDNQRKNDFASLNSLNQAVIQGADHLIITTDKQGIIMSFNKGAETSLGYRAEELIGQSTPSIFHDPDEVVQRAQKLTAAGIPVTSGFEVFVVRSRTQQKGDVQEWTYIRKDGSRLPVSLNVTALRDAAGEITAFLGIATDVSDYKRKEAALKESAQLVKSIVETVADGIVTIDAHGTILSFNTAAERLFGFSVADVLGTNVKCLMPAFYAAGHDGYLSRYLQTRKPHVIGIGREVVGQRKDGSTFPMDLAVSEMQQADQSLFVGIVRDITERKRMERMKSEFVSTVSHELRTPLTSIRGALGLVIGKFANELPDKARQLLETASRNCERLTILINDILDLEKIESGQLDFEFKSLDLTALARQAISANEGYGQQHRVRLRLLDTPEAALVWGDEHRLLQVFANFISNAVKYSATEGVVDVSIHRHHNRLRVGIHNIGRGIPAAFRNQIFQRFAQADSSDTREKGGTGLGLSITKAIVERHDGYIGFTSEEGGSTEFFFDLPEWQEVIEQAPATDNLRPNMLICEDNADVAMVLAELLEQEGITSDRVGTAAAALKMLKLKSYRCLLLDLGLPDMDGLALMEILRNDEATCNLLVIIVSGRGREGTLITVDTPVSGQLPDVAANADVNSLTVLDWLQKPVDRTRLGQALKQALQHYKRPSILHVEDDLDVIQVIQALLEESSDYTYATSLAAARHEISVKHHDLLLLDVTLPDGSGLELLETLKPETQVIIFSCQASDALLKQHVTAALTKSKTTNHQLLDTIRQVVNKNQKRS
jgi:PAS domain S-box-containing protein